MPAARTGADATAAARDARRLSTLLEVSQALSGTLNLKSSMQRVLATLIRHHSVVRGMVTLLRDGELLVEAVEGFEDRARTVRFKLGEGITGKVVESGRPIVVPRVSREPAFLNLAPRRPDHPKQELSFICVPVMMNRAAVGALAVDLRFKPERDYDSSVKSFGIVSSMIAQALNVQRLVEEERRRLSLAAGDIVVESPVRALGNVGDASCPPPSLEPTPAPPRGTHGVCRRCSR